MPVEGREEVGRGAARVLGRHPRPPPVKSTSISASTVRPFAGGAPGQPACGALARDGVHDVGEVGDAVGGAGSAGRR